MQLPWTQYRRLPRSPAGFDLQQMRGCPLCGASDENVLLELADFQFFDDQAGLNRADHRVVMCNQCGFLFTNPCYTPKGFALLFEKAGCSYGHSDIRPNEQYQWLAAQCPGTMSVMDIGCGMGDFLKALPAEWQRIGVEVDAALVARANQNAQGVSFMRGDLSGRLELPQVDVMTMFHVLEHVPDPVNVLKELRRNSRNDTRLVVEVPLIDRASSMQNKDIVGFFSVQHLSHFSRNSLLTMLGMTGWEVLRSEEMEGYNGYRILAAPAEPKSLEVDDAKKVWDGGLASDYMSGWRLVVEAVNSRFDALGDDDQVVIWGGGQHSEYLALLTSLFNDRRRFVIVDSDPLKSGTFYHSIPVLAPDEISEETWATGRFKIVISTYGSQEVVKEAIIARGVDPSRIMTLYDEIRRY